MRAVGLSVLVGGDGRHGSSHADLDMVVPVPGTGAAVDLKHNSVLLNLDFGDLNLVAAAGCGAVFIEHLLPGALVVLTVASDDKRMFGARQDDFESRHFGVEPTLDLHPLIEAEFIGARVAGAEEKRKCQDAGYSLRFLAMAACCGRTGAFQIANNRPTTKMVASNPPSGP